MNKTINQLLQLQDLEMAMREQEVMGKRKRASEASGTLDECIHALRMKLEPEPAGVYERIRKRYQVYVVPMLHDACSGCFMKLPVGDVSAIKHGEMWLCPNCNRFLYFDPHQKRPTENRRYKGLARF